jgi:hypothetical protein
MSWQSQGTAILAASLVRPFALAAVAWLILRALRVRHPASLHAVWTAVLGGVLLVPVVSVITPHWKLPLLPRRHDHAARPNPNVMVPAGFDLPRGFPSIQALILGCYLAGLFAMMTYRAMGVALGGA